MGSSSANDAAKVALAYIESLTTRFETAERHINDDIEAIEKRLGQLVELMKTVSTMQQQLSSQQQTLNEVRTVIRDNLAQIETLMDGVDSKYVVHFDAMKKRIIDGLGEQSDKSKKIEGRVSALEDKVHVWTNRGIGMWAVLTLVFGFFQYVAMQYIGNLQQEKEAAQATITRVSSRMADLEMRIQAYENLNDRTVPNVGRPR